MTAEAIARALGGRKAGDGWVMCCPAHDDRRPSLSIRGGINEKVLVHCHAGCDQERVIDALRARRLWPEHVRAFGPRFPRRIQARSRLEPGATIRAEPALRIWRSAKTCTGTIVGNYLNARGIGLAIPPALRFHPQLKHQSGGFWPAMVAAVCGVDGEVGAIQRTFLSPQGGGKAPVEPQRMMLGSCRGRAVQLARPDDFLMVGEGIETCLAAMQATGHPAWAALSASGLRSLNLPDRVRKVVILADGDSTGEAAAKAAAARWAGEHRSARIARPIPGFDFNDMLLGRCTTEEGAS